VSTRTEIEPVSSEISEHVNALRSTVSPEAEPAITARSEPGPSSLQFVTGRVVVVTGGGVALRSASSCHARSATRNGVPSSRSTVPIVAGFSDGGAPVCACSVPADPASASAAASGRERSVR